MKFLQISPTPQKLLEKKPMKTYKRNKNLLELIGDDIPQRKKVFKTHLLIVKDESTNKSPFHFAQVVNTKTFESHQTKRVFKIYYKLNCKNSIIIYLMEYTLSKI